MRKTIIYFLVNGELSRRNPARYYDSDMILSDFAIREFFLKFGANHHG